MYSIRKLGGLSLIAMALAMPCVALAAGDTQVASKAYVDTKISKNQGVANAGKVLKINASGIVEPGDGIDPGALDGYVEENQGTANKNKLMVTNNSGVVTTSSVTDMLSGTYVEKAQGVANKVLITDASGNVTTGTINTEIDDSVTTTAGSGDAYVVNSVTASGNTVSVTRGTIKIPVSSGAPSTNTPTGYSEIWIE